MHFGFPTWPETSSSLDKIELENDCKEGTFDNEFGFEAAVWKIWADRKKTVEKSKVDGKQIPNGRQARQQKTAKFMNMGEAEVENEADLRTWLLSEKDKPA